ncbi:hypothetical protein Tco_0301485, partial [Tanacetum coccineum]
DSVTILSCVAWTCLAASSFVASIKLIDFPNSKAMSGSGMMLSSTEIESFFLITLLPPVHFLVSLASDSSSLAGFGETTAFLPYDPLPLVFFGGIRPVEYLMNI